jgi:hypothetical protein
VATSTAFRADSDGDDDKPESQHCLPIMLDFPPSLPVMVIGDSLRLKQAPPLPPSPSPLPSSVTCCGTGAVQLAEQRHQGECICSLGGVKCERSLSLSLSLSLASSRSLAR